MDHVSALRQRVGDLRAEIARIQGLNEQHRREQGHDTVTQMAHLQRLSRLEEIRDELSKLAELGRRSIAAKDDGDDDRAGTPFLVKKAS